MIEIVRHTQRNVKRWHDGDMRKRWTAAGMLVAEQQFRRIIGYRDLANLVIAIERHALLAAANEQRPSGDSPNSLPSDRQPVGPPSKFHDDPDILLAPRVRHFERWRPVVRATILERPDAGLPNTPEVFFNNGS